MKSRARILLQRPMKRSYAATLRAENVANEDYDAVTLLIKSLASIRAGIAPYLSATSMFGWISPGGEFHSIGCTGRALDERFGGV